MLRSIVLFVLIAAFGFAGIKAEPMSAEQSEGHLLQIEQALAAGRLVQADAMLHGLKDKVATGYHNRINLLLADLHATREEITAAEAAITQVDGILVDSCRYNDVLGRIAFQRLQWKAAGLHIATAIELCPADAGRWNLLGQSLSHAGEYKASIEAYDAALRLKPDHAALLNNRALAYGYDGASQSALADLVRAVQIDPDNSLFRQNLAFLKANLGLPLSTLADGQEAESGVMLAKAGEGALAAQREGDATAYFAQALLKMERFDAEIWRRANGKQ